MKLRKVADTFRSPLFWATARVLRELQSLLHSLEGWVGSCICHPYLKTEDSDGSSSRYKRQLQYSMVAGLPRDSGAGACCPMTGCLAPEVVDGVLTQQLDYYRTLHSGHVLRIAASVESAEDRDALLSDFEAGIGIITSILAVKIESYQHLPLLLAGLASLNPATVRDTARRCLGEYDAVGPCTRNKLGNKQFSNMFQL